MTAPTSPKPTTKKARKAVDWPAVMFRAAAQGMQIVPLDGAQWAAAIGTDARVVVDGPVIWMSPRAQIEDLETALLEMDCHSHKFLIRPNEVVEIGGPTSGPRRSVELRRSERITLPELDL